MGFFAACIAVNVGFEVTNSRDAFLCQAQSVISACAADGNMAVWIRCVMAREGTKRLATMVASKITLLFNLAQEGKDGK